MSRQEPYSTGRTSWGTWPRYDAAVLGFADYWYPVLWSRELGKNPVPLTILGQKLVLIRDGGKPHVLHDRCPHRGTPLSLGASRLGRKSFSRRWFPGTISCGYHGWTYDLATGELVAALTDGPQSPICGKVRVRTYPVEERLGLIWVYLGAGKPSPLENDIPKELLERESTICGRFSVRKGDWRYAAENGIDEAHPRYLHRNSLWRFFNQLPCWTRTHIEMLEEGTWITYVADEVRGQAEFPGLGKWPPRKWWKKFKGGNPRVSIRLPGTLRVSQPDWTIYAWFMPIDEQSHRYLQLAVKFTGGMSRRLFPLRYWGYIRWVNQHLFTGQDAVMIQAMDAPPERLFRPDLSIIAWRKLCEGARGQGSGRETNGAGDFDESELKKLTKDYTAEI
jgi:phenylpropionate dioxygenase-like ring-hydroxylating dioxygenase large terminal subunit